MLPTKSSPTSMIPTKRKNRHRNGAVYQRYLQSVTVPHTLVNSEQARYMIGRTRPCSLCAFSGNRRCKECKGKAFIPTPLKRAVMRHIKRAMAIKSRKFVLQAMKAFLRKNPTFIFAHSKSKQNNSSHSLLFDAWLELENHYRGMVNPWRRQKCAKLMNRIQAKLKIQNLDVQPEDDYRRKK